MANTFDDIITCSYKEYHQIILNYITYRITHRCEAEDLAQDVFTKLWTNFETWQNDDGKEGYIYAMAKNVAFDFIKHKRLENDYREEQIKKSTIKDLLGFSDPLNSLYYKEIQLIIRMALENFPERRRRIFEMSRFNNMSNQEIALSLHLSVRTIEHQIYLSLQVLKRIILILFFLYFL